MRHKNLIKKINKNKWVINIFKERNFEKKFFYSEIHKANLFYNFNVDLDFKNDNVEQSWFFKANET